MCYVRGIITLQLVIEQFLHFRFHPIDLLLNLPHTWLKTSRRFFYACVIVSDDDITYTTGVIALSSEHTLADYTHWVTPHMGVQLEFVEELQTLIAKDVPCGVHQCALSMDEMKIKSGLVFNKYTGALSGFIDLGKCSHETEQVLSGPGDSKKEGEQRLADQVFVFMARAVFKHLYLYMWRTISAAT